eukprot:12938646-Prorocentrum_lima.AAC.1
MDKTRREGSVPIRKTGEHKGESRTASEIAQRTFCPKSLSEEVYLGSSSSTGQKLVPVVRGRTDRGHDRLRAQIQQGIHGKN